MSRKGNWMQTVGGHKFWPMDTRLEDFRIGEIAHALSNVCRFAGHCRNFYSVAEHSVLVSWECDPDDALEGLLHDTAEAYIGDMVQPLKLHMDAYREVEEKMEAVIAARFGLKWPWPDSVKKADFTVLLAEVRDIMATPPEPWSLPPGIKASEAKIIGHAPAEAKRMFLERWNELKGTHQ